MNSDSVQQTEDERGPDPVRPARKVIIRRRPPMSRAKVIPVTPPYAHNMRGAAERAALSELTLRNEIKAGRLRARRRGANLLILDSDLVEYLNSLPEVK